VILVILFGGGLLGLLPQVLAVADHYCPLVREYREHFCAGFFVWGIAIVIATIMLSVSIEEKKL
jgi:hypothetical protein